MGKSRRRQYPLFHPIEADSPSVFAGLSEGWKGPATPAAEEWLHNLHNEPGSIKNIPPHLVLTLALAV
jgi:hypothetical protein